MKPLFIIAAIAIIGLIIYNTQIKDKEIIDINITKISDELNITRKTIKNPAQLMRDGVEIPLATMCKKADGILFNEKCYEDKEKEKEPNKGSI